MVQLTVGALIEAGIIAWCYAAVCAVMAVERVELDDLSTEEL